MNALEQDVKKANPSTKAARAAGSIAPADGQTAKKSNIEKNEKPSGKVKV